MGTQENVKHLEECTVSNALGMGILSSRSIGCDPSGHQAQVSRPTCFLRHYRNDARHHHWRDSVRERTR
uniref:Uncharacterized protein n=1 Tax=Brassica oleracea var. oleracea TaxID=109376 RepID=A0A0D3D7N5_BRAOL